MLRHTPSSFAPAAIVASAIAAWLMMSTGARANRFEPLPAATTLAESGAGGSTIGASAAISEPAVIAPILMYHQIDGRSGRYSVPLARFAAQMQWLHANGYHAVSVEHIAAAARGELVLPAKPVAITFDDGWQSQFTKAKPVLDALGFKATFFIVSGYINRPNAYMSWDDVRQLAAEGHWIGSHSVSHRASTRLSAAELAIEMRDSRDAIGHQIGRAVTAYSYPFGARNAFVEDMARTLGYTCGVAVGAAWQHRPSRVFSMPRIEIQGGTGILEFAGWLTGKPVLRPAPARTAAPSADVPERVIPPAANDPR